MKLKISHETLPINMTDINNIPGSFKLRQPFKPALHGVKRAGRLKDNSKSIIKEPVSAGYNTIYSPFV